jgi:signal-transduction protein with cAMP-binding, CBS, and nucleotidyltransferase domain
MQDIAGFLGTHPPFDSMGTEELARLAATTEMEFSPAATTIFSQGSGPVEHLWVVRTGAGQLDIKHGGLIPIVDLARWAGLHAGLASASTVERLQAAEAAGILESGDARTLIEAFGFIFSLRLDHQVEQLRRGETPDDFIDPKTLNPLARSYLKEAFRAVSSVQSGLANELSFGIRWS